MKTSILPIFVLLSLATACGGQVAGTPGSGGNQGTGTGAGGGSGTGSGSGSGTGGGNPGNPGNPGGPGNPGNPGSPAIVYDASPAAKGGQFTAVTAADFDPTGAYVAETVFDASTGNAAMGTTMWRVAVGGAPDQKTSVLSDPTLGIALALAIRTGDSNAADANLVWLDGTDAAGALKTNSGTAITTIAKPIVGSAIVINGKDIYADYDGQRCVAEVNGANPSCTSASFGLPLQGGSGFHIVDGTLYAADNTNVYTVDLQTNDVKTEALPSALTALDQPVFDVAPGPDGAVYLATRAGVWKKDAASVFTNIYGSTITQQVEVSGIAAYANVIGTGLVRIDLATNASSVVSSDLAINTRFAMTTKALYFIGAAQKSVQHIAL